MKVLFVSKKTIWCEKAKSVVLKNFDEVDIAQGEWGQPKPEIFTKWNGGDYIISYLSPWLIPKKTLQEVRKKAINFHPGPPKYGGIGCYNFALYNQETSYGVLCHEMNSDVDSGSIIQVKRFPITDNETVASLKEKSMIHLFELFQQIIEKIHYNHALPVSNEQWKHKPYTRKELQQLCRITKDMSKDEIHKRIRATFFPGARDIPYLEVDGKKITLKGETIDELENSII